MRHLGQLGLIFLLCLGWCDQGKAVKMTLFSTFFFPSQTPQQKLDDAFEYHNRYLLRKHAIEVADVTGCWVLSRFASKIPSKPLRVFSYIGLIGVAYVGPGARLFQKTTGYNDKQLKLLLNSRFHQSFITLPSYTSDPQGAAICSAHFLNKYKSCLSNDWFFGFSDQKYLSEVSALMQKTGLFNPYLHALAALDCLDKAETMTPKRRVKELENILASLQTLQPDENDAAYYSALQEAVVTKIEIGDLEADFVQEVEIPSFEINKAEPLRLFIVCGHCGKFHNKVSEMTKCLKDHLKSKVE